MQIQQCIINKLVLGKIKIFWAECFSMQLLITSPEESTIQAAIIPCSASKLLGSAWPATTSVDLPLFDVSSRSPLCEEDFLDRGETFDIS
jgi:hypothetical protein